MMAEEAMPPADSAIEAAAAKPDSAELRRAAAHYLREFARRDNRDQVNRLRRVALAWNRHHELHSDPRSGARALRYVMRALKTQDPTSPAAERVRLLDTAANTYRGVGRSLGRFTVLAKAQGFFEQALDLLGDGKPEDWCTVANSLATVHEDLHNLGRNGHEQRAIELYRKARAVAIRNKVFRQWANAAVNALRMERNRADARPNPEALKRAARRMRRLLGVFERVGGIESFAARHMLAVTLCKIADHHYDRGTLDEAAALWRANLAEWPQSRSAQRWAEIMNSLGLVDATICEKEASLPAGRRAESIFLDICDFPSRSASRRRRAPPAWTHEHHSKNYISALLNLSTVRERIADMTGTIAPIRQNLEDISHFLDNADTSEPAVSARAKYVLAGSLIALAHHQPGRAQIDEAERASLDAAAEFEALASWSEAVLTLTAIGALMLDAAAGPHARQTLERARSHLRRARDLFDGSDETSDLYVSAWRLHTLVELRLASVDGDAAEAQSIAGDVAAYLSRLGGLASPVQRLLLELLRVDAAAVVARIRDTQEDHALLAAQAEAFLTIQAQALLDPAALRESGRQVLAVRVLALIALAHARNAMGDVGSAIAHWTQAQNLIWRGVMAAGTANVAQLAMCAVGDTRKHLLAGKGLSLADELAMALLSRAGSGDLDRALSVIARGRSIAAALQRIPDADVQRLRQRLRAIEDRLESTDALRSSRRSRTASRLSGQRDRLRAEVGRRWLDTAPSSDDALGLAASLPEGLVSCVVVLAERRAALVLLGRDSNRRPIVHPVVLEGLDRSSVDHLLVDDDKDCPGLLAAIEGLQELGAGSRPSQEVFLEAVTRFNASVARCTARLVPALIDPLSCALARHFGTHARRLRWHVPGAMWPLPLHVMSPTAGRELPASSYGRSLSVSPPEQDGATGRTRQVLIVDNPRGDIGAPTPFPEELLSGQPFTWTRLAGKASTRRAILRELKQADLFLFNGHGQHIAGEPDRSGLQVWSSRPPHRMGDGRDGLLSVAAIRGLRLHRRSLAVLCACDVGSIELQTAVDEFAGMPAELLDAGFNAVIAATWPVEQNATSMLIRSLVADLPAADGDPAPALTRAQASLSASSAKVSALQTLLAGARLDRVPTAGQVQIDMSSPFWWAGFRLIEN